MRHVNLDSIDGVVDAFHKKISALTLGQGNSSCPWGSAIVTLTLTPSHAAAIDNPKLCTLAFKRRT